MGTTGSRLKKLRKSLRRISLSRSRERLDRSDQARRSTSLMNLSSLRKEFIQKKKSRSTLLLPQSCRDDLKNSEISINGSTDIQNISGITVLSCSVSNTSEIVQNKQELSQSQDIFGTAGELKFDFEEKDVTTIAGKEIEVETQKDNLTTEDNEMIPKKLSIDVSSNDSFMSKFEENSVCLKSPETEPVPHVDYERKDCSGVKALKIIDDTLYDLERRIEEMPYDDLIVHLCTFKDEIHTLWIKSYEIKESSDQVHPKKCDTIDYTKSVLQKLYNKAFKQFDYRTTETDV